MLKKAVNKRRPPAQRTRRKQSSTEKWFGTSHPFTDKSTSSQFENAFLREWFKRCPNLAAPIPEWYGIPNHRNRFDFAWPLKTKTGGVAVEMEGIQTGNGFKSGHTTMVGYSKDCAKYNLAQLNGWLVLRYTQLLLKTTEDWDYCIDQISQVVQGLEQDGMLSDLCAPVTLTQAEESVPDAYYLAWKQRWKYPPAKVKPVVEKQPKPKKTKVKEVALNERSIEQQE